MVRVCAVPIMISPRDGEPPPFPLEGLKVVLELLGVVLEVVLEEVLVFLEVLPPPSRPYDLKTLSVVLIGP